MERWEQLRERLARARAEFEAWWSRLAPRERVMVASAAAVAALFVVSLTWGAVQSRISARQANIDRKTAVLAQVSKLAQSYRQAQVERAQLEARLKGQPVQLMTFVAQTGQKLGIEVNDLRPGTSTPPAPGENVVEETVEVNLAHLDLPRLATLLQDLERAPGVVKVRRLALRTRNDDPNAVDVTVVVASYQLKG